MPPGFNAFRLPGTVRPAGTLPEMQRIPEPELMDDPVQAEAYAAADFAEIHEMRISNTSDFSGAMWEPFQATGKMWMLPTTTIPGSIATVYAEFRNIDGLMSAGPSIGSIRYLPFGLFMPIVIGQ